MAKKPMKMSARELQAAIRKQIWSAHGYIGGEISEARRKSMEYYLGEPFGNEIEGRSQVVSTDVQDVVEGVLPDIIQVFTSSDKAVMFNPVGQEDEQFADQATDYVNHVWNVDNDGFNIFYDWFKDALLQIDGTIKVTWDATPKVKKTKHTGLSDDQLASLLDGEDAEVLEHTEYLSDEAEQLAAQHGTSIEDPIIQAVARLHDVTIERIDDSGRVRIENIPPEEFYISRRARSLEDADFLAHRRHLSQSELIEMGFDREQVDKVPSGDDDVFDDEHFTRHDREDEFGNEEIDRATRSIEVHECYVKVDYDGDGLAELRKITVAGPNHEILNYEDGGEANEEVDDHPFCHVTPIRMPHRYSGRSLADLVMDLQLIKSSIWRQTLDNMYNVNNSRAAISNKVNLDDYLDNRVGGAIRVDTDVGDAGAHIAPIITPSIANHSFPLLEYADQVRETRSGVTRMGQGLDPDAMNSTARGMNMLLGRQQQRTLLIAQVFAFGGVRDAFRKILKLVIAHQDKPRTIRLRNQWVEMDPKNWNTEMDVTINVGLGRGTQDQRITTTNMVLQRTQELVAMQGGVGGPFVLPHHLRNAYAEFFEAVGLRSADPYINDIDEQASQQIVQGMGQQEDPEAEARKADIQLKQADMQLKAQESQANYTLKVNEQQMEHIRKLQEMGLKAEAEQAALDLKAWQAQQDQMIKEYTAAVNARAQMVKAA